MIFMSQNSFKTFLYLPQTQDLVSIIIIYTYCQVVAMKLQGQKSDVYSESESKQKESYQYYIQLQPKQHREFIENRVSRKMDPKEAGLQKKKDYNLKKHKKINHIKEYQNNRNCLQSPSTDDKIFYSEQNVDINLSQAHNVQFAPPIFGQSRNILPDEQGGQKYQENSGERKKIQCQNKKSNKKKENKDTKNLLQFFWNTLKNKFEIFESNDQITQFSIWLSKNKGETPSMKLITELYQFKEIQHFLMTLFQTKFFHRALMLSSTKIQNKKIFFKFLRSLQRSFFNKKLDHIH